MNRQDMLGETVTNCQGYKTKIIGMVDNADLVVVSFPETGETVTAPYAKFRNGKVCSKYDRRDANDAGCILVLSLAAAGVLVLITAMILFFK